MTLNVNTFQLKADCGKWPNAHTKNTLPQGCHWQLSWGTHRELLANWTQQSVAETNKVQAVLNGHALQTSKHTKVINSKRKTDTCRTRHKQFTHKEACSHALFPLPTTHMHVSQNTHTHTQTHTPKTTAHCTYTLMHVSIYIYIYEQQQ